MIIGSKPRPPLYDPSRPLARGLVAGWTMSEGGGEAKDVTRVHNAALTVGSWAYSKRDFAISLNGISDYLTVADHDNLDGFRDIAIVAGVTPAAVSFVNTILSKGSTSGNFSYAMFLGTAYSSTFSWQVGGYGTLNTITTVAANTYYNVVFQRNGGSGVHQTFINGRQDSTNTFASGNLRANAIPIYFGQYAGGNLYSGLIHYIFLYNRCLSSQEVLQLHIDPYAAFRPRSATRFILSATPPTGSTVQLSWTDNSGGTQTFNIERSATSAYAGFSEVSTGQAGPTYDDTELSDGAYWYRVRGYDGAEYSDYSNVVEITVTT